METVATVTEQNIALVQNAFADFLNGNIQGVINACSEDVEWGGYENDVTPISGMYHGKVGVARFFTLLAESVDYTLFDPREFFADGNNVFVKGRHEGRAKPTGKSFGHDFMMQFVIRNGKVTYFFAWTDTYDQAKAYLN